MMQVLITELIIATFTTAIVATLGWLAQRRRLGGIVIPTLALGVSSLFIIALSAIGYQLAAVAGGWIGVLAGMGLCLLVVPRLVVRFIKAESVRRFAWILAGLYAINIWGYLAAGLIGALASVAAVFYVFLTILYRLTKHVLPLPQDHSRHDLEQVLRCMVSYSLGTHYPVFVVRDGKVEKRVEGNAFRQFFAGPGLVLAGPDQAAYVSNGVKISQIAKPGISFTGQYDQEVRAVDLRSQLRAFNVEATTRDGINIRVLAFIPFRLRCGKQQPSLPGSFPVSEQAVMQLARSELVERRRGKKGSVRHKLEDDLVPVVMTPVIQDIIARYRLDDLCVPGQGGADPRVEIVQTMLRKAKIILRSYGLEPVGGGISNLVPLDEEVPARRIDNWKTEWENQVLRLMSEARAESSRQIEMARLEAELQVVARFTQIKLANNLSPEVTQAAIALSFVDCLGQMLHESEQQWPMPESLRHSLSRLRGQLERDDAGPNPS